MSGEVSDIEKQLDFVLSRVSLKKFKLEKTEKCDERLLTTFTSLYGLFT